MKESKKNINNNVHLYGYINDVRIKKLDNGKTLIGIDIVTLEQYKSKEGEFKNKRTYHNGVLFPEDKALIKKFTAIAKDCAKNIKNRDVEGFKPETHSISLNGYLSNPDAGSSNVSIIIDEKTLDIDVKQEENEIRNRADFVGNIGAIDIYDDKRFATVRVAHHFRPEGAEKEFETWLNVRVDGDRLYSKNTYDAIVKGEVAKGDFVRLGGQLHNNNFETKDGKKVYGVVLDLTTFQKLEKKEAEAEKVEVKEEPKVEPKKAAPKKAAPKKKAAAPKL